ncbi:MAG: ABC transporter permease [Nitrososphaerales archaeon]|jgi:ABC-2 type transport system permease protein
MSEDNTSGVRSVKTGVPEPVSAANGTWGQEKTDRSPLHGLWALTNRELVKWYKAPVLLFLSLIQPVIWLGLFGKAMNFGQIFSGSFSALSSFLTSLGISQQNINKIITAMPSVQSIFGTSDYFSFLAVGMLSFVILFTAMFSGMSIVWDRRFGFLDKVLSTPVSRGTLVMGKILASVVRSLIQAAMVLVIAIILGMSTANMSAVGVLGTFTGLFMMTMGFSALFLMLALRSTDWQTQMAVMNLLNLPLLFGSNALFPSSFMPSWLQDFVKINPISYATDIGRQLLLGSPGFAPLGFDFLYLAGFAALFSVIGIVMSWRLLTK